ncbi:MAG: nuclear transport factor 2 family protein [Pseudomonadota bacterium]
MQGFGPDYADPPDYILKVTRQIWEDRGIATLRRSYAPDILVRSPASIVQGNQGVIAATLATLAEFPDRTLLGEDVIWAEAGEGAFLSSHRLYSQATHLGDGAYGPATGRPLRYRIIADCHARGDVIDDEWIIRDQGAIVRQMGQDPRDWAADRIAAHQAAHGAPPPPPFRPEDDRPGPYRGAGNADEWGERYADLLTRIMAADFAAIPAEYDRACRLEHPGGVSGASHADADRFWMGLRAAFPSATFTVHHRIGRDDPLMPPRAAIRWSLDGPHDGWGAFGPPTGARVHVMGLCHAEFGPWGLRREWALYDETAVWTQILLHQG